jgi:hypothetical protein
MAAPGAVQRCPMDGPSAQHTAVAHQHAKHHIADPGKHRVAHSCTCPSTCCGTPLAGGLKADTSGLLALLSFADRILPTPEASRPRVAPDHLRPFSTAPPAPSSLLS